MNYTLYSFQKTAGIYKLAISPKAAVQIGREVKRIGAYRKVPEITTKPLRQVAEAYKKSGRRVPAEIRRGLQAKPMAATIPSKGYAKREAAHKLKQLKDLPRIGVPEEVRAGIEGVVKSQGKPGRWAGKFMQPRRGGMIGDIASKKTIKGVGGEEAAKLTKLKKGMTPDDKKVLQGMVGSHEMQERALTGARSKPNRAWGMTGGHAGPGVLLGDHVRIVSSMKNNPKAAKYMQELRRSTGEAGMFKQLYPSAGKFGEGTWRPSRHAQKRLNELAQKRLEKKIPFGPAKAPAPPPPPVAPKPTMAAPKAGRLSKMRDFMSGKKKDIGRQSKVMAGKALARGKSMSMSNPFGSKKGFSGGNFGGGDFGM